MKFVIYYRVSTVKQGKSGLGLEAQKRDIDLYLKSYVADEDKPVEILGEFTDIASGSKSNRDGYQKAIQLTKRAKATLLVAKLDRLSRSVADIANLIEVVDVKVACLPNATSFELHIYASLAEQERKFISLRTKQALEAKKAQGAQLGNPNWIGNNGDEKKLEGRNTNTKAATETRQATTSLKDVEVYEAIQEARNAGITSLRAIAQYLTDTHHVTPRGGKYGATSVRLVIQRMEANQ
ncbi:recombinase family protein [Enterovibrio norvegicus]|uniref:recombinase family protein n=1 Tax=Enterovibrio norvegicus TaxID=188144 RepID=UPI000C81A2D1|nr:recombinase family protein [Enterovibrio norvegicus]PMN64308.1 hypothetical protein BCT27_10105 [Enterovibrio norvegicus]